VFGNRVLRRLSGPKRDKVMRGQRNLAGHVARMSEKRNSYRLFVGKPERRRPLGRLICRWVDLGDIGWGGVDWIGMAQDRNKW
jgi:hypothetical protein